MSAEWIDGRINEQRQPESSCPVAIEELILITQPFCRKQQRSSNVKSIQSRGRCTVVSGSGATNLVGHAR